MEKVTVLLAVLNKKETIEKCVESLLKIDYPSYKVMVVDGYSKDGTYEILQKYRGKIELRQFPENLSKTFNWAISRIKTEYFALTDGDCVVDKNWLKELLEGFQEKEVVATAGFCGTPKDVSTLQKVIGCELENRFKKFPKYISRAPTMNLAVKTEVAKKVKFIEEQRVGVEFSFGYLLTKLGKMRYIPEAKVFHYHRSTWKGFFRQNRAQARWGLYLLSRFKKEALGDHITTKIMFWQIYLFALSISFSFLSFFNRFFILAAVISLFILGSLYYWDFRQYEKNLNSKWYKKYPVAAGFYLVRNLALMVGLVEGVFIFLKTMTKKDSLSENNLS